MKRIVFSLAFFLVLFFPFYYTFSQTPLPTESNICSVYFTGIGCPHCARSDPVVLEKLFKKYPNFIVIEYEVYQREVNAPIEGYYNTNYGTGFGIPLIVFGKGEYLKGDENIILDLEKVVSGLMENKCPLPDGSQEYFENINVNSLPGLPKIWRDTRVLVKEDKNRWIFAWNGNSLEKKENSHQTEKNEEILKNLILEDNFLDVLEKARYRYIGSYKAPLSGKEVSFDNAVELSLETLEEGALVYKMTLPEVILLASVDSINPCALAVLLLMLLGILTYNPNKKRDVLLAGFSFVTSIFLMYFFYGLVIVKFFQIIHSLSLFQIWLYKALGVFAIILGVLNTKDFFFYKPGGFMTEMPLSWRPKAKKLISGITSPKGAFAIGIFVTLFLLPCTMGPYFIAGGLLSSSLKGISHTIPWLLLYNFIFILPMLLIVFFVWQGIKGVKDIQAWKAAHITKIHLIAGIIMIILGIIMIWGQILFKGSLF